VRGVPAASGERRAIPERLLWTVETLVVEPDEHLLEVGCGPGVAVDLVSERLVRGTITAIDRSATMVARARRRNQAHIAAGRARIEQQTLADATFHDGSLATPFTKVFAVNVNAFWTAPAPSFSAARRTLSADGALFLVYEPPSAARLRSLRRQLRILLPAHGFQVADERVRDLGKSRGVCVIGRPV
jgi:cyclopropane fatty-acyl-phospholipid synthase-like methyltransferase